MIMKFRNSPKNAPQPILNGPMVNIAVLQAPPGINGAIGIIMLSTNDFTKVVIAAPITKAIARPTTLYSFKIL